MSFEPVVGLLACLVCGCIAGFFHAEKRPFMAAIWIALAMYMAVASVGKANPASSDCVPPAKPVAALQTQLSPPSGGAEFPAGLRAGGPFLGQV
jgi:hypothetical protein